MFSLRKNRNKKSIYLNRFYRGIVTLFSKEISRSKNFIVKTLYFYLKSTILFAFLLITDQKYYKRFRLDYIKVWTNVFFHFHIKGWLSLYHSLHLFHQRIIYYQFSTWKILLNAAKIRNHEEILIQAEELKEEEVPVLQYHRQCYQQFTHKS